MSLRKRISLRACFVLYVACAGFGGSASSKTFMKPVNWNAENFPSGDYVYRMASGNQIDSKKVILLK